MLDRYCLSMTANDWVLPKAGILAQMFLKIPELRLSTNVSTKHRSPAFGNTLLAAVFIFSSILKF